MILTRHATRRAMVIVATGILLPLTVTATNSGAADTTSTLIPTNLVAPAIPNVPALPGPVTPTFTLSPTMGNLTVSPNQGVEGAPLTISGRGLPASTSVAITWSTSSVTWVLSPQPDTVNYLGRTSTNFFVTLATVTTNASGSFSYATTAPVDFGGTHDIYAVVNNVAVDHAGYELLRTLTVSPRSGPIGTPIHITYTGMGATLYTGGAAVLYDNHFTGEMTAFWTRGTASVTIRAAGAVGPHLIQVADALSSMYMNIIQSPVPYANGGVATFTVTRGKASLAPSISWPTSVAPTLKMVTTLSNAGLDPKSDAVATASPADGPVGTKVNLTVTGLTGSGPYQLAWASVQGSRVNCASASCWAYISVPLGTASASGGTLNTSVTVPDGLGGWHVMQVLNGSTVESQTPFYVKESMVPFYSASGKLLSEAIATANDAATPAALAVGQSGTGTYTFKQGQEITISLKGVGWTQLDNTLGVDYDNSYIGYGCGFNSNGYTVIHLRATGGPGIHLIDLYPQLYTQQPSFANTPYGMAPVLTYARDFPGLALGYQVPSMHFAIKIVK